MPNPYIDTPRDDESHFSNGIGLDRLSPEKSFAVPQDGDLISQMKRGRSNGVALKTPRVGPREPLKVLANGNHGKAEFTPLLKSVARTNISRRLSARKSGKTETPSYLRNSYVAGTTPVLPRMDDSNLHNDHTNSSAGPQDHTPMPQNISSSTQGTPLAQLPGPHTAVSDGNMMTLREQENIIDKIEKENFGLKMKIHFLEEAISKRGGEFNQAALKENTDLKVNRITMQRELHKFKKTLAQAERDAEIYRQQLEEYRERIRRKQLDESVRIELEAVRSELKAKDVEIEELRSNESNQNQGDAEVEKLREEIGDLEAELREKDRQIEEKEDEIDSMKVSSQKESRATADLEDELENLRQQLEDMREDFERAVREAKEAREEQSDVEDEKRRAEQDLDELRDEIANKSFTTKGLNRQLEDRVDRLELERAEQEDKRAALRNELEEKNKSERNLQEQIREAERENMTRLRHIQEELQNAQHERDVSERKNNNAQRQVEDLERNLQVKIEENDLLHTRHDALISESAQLQKELEMSREAVNQLESALELEREKTSKDDIYLQQQHKNEIDILNEQIDSLHQESSSKAGEHVSQSEEWAAQKRELEALNQRAEEKAHGLQRTVDKLQDTQGTLSGRETKLHEAFESEKQRYLEESNILKKQIQELNDDLSAKRVTADQNRSELSNAKEELRISIREQAVLQEKVSELEDEIEVLQADIEQEHQFVLQLQSQSSGVSEPLIGKLRKDKLDLQETVANLGAQLQTAKNAAEVVEAERDDFEAKLHAAQHSSEDTFDGQQEKRELRRAKQALERDLAQVRAETESLAAKNNDLDAEVNQEIERSDVEKARLQVQIDQLKNQISQSKEDRNRELTAAKAKIARLEISTQNLEDQRSRRPSISNSPNAALSDLRTELSNARQNETAATNRETDLKSNNRQLKIQIKDLEKELHEVRLTLLKTRSPSATSSPSQSKELAQLRQELAQARADLHVLHLDRIERKSGHRESTADVLNEPLRYGRDEEIANLKSHIRRLRSERDEFKTLSLATGAADNAEAIRLKSELQRVRQERTRAAQKADVVSSELEVLQSRYEGMLEKLAAIPSHHSNSPTSSDPEIKAKEIKGLLREILYLKSSLRREQRLRADLAWSKAYLEGEGEMRVQCNAIDLRILREMGVDIDRYRTKYTTTLSAKQKLRAGIFVVMAAIRMRKMEEGWRNKRLLGDELRLMKGKAREHLV